MTGSIAALLLWAATQGAGAESPEEPTGEDASVVISEDDRGVSLMAEGAPSAPEAPPAPPSAPSEGKSLGLDMSDPKAAEYHRLVMQMNRFAERNAWGGVERTYKQIESLGLPMAPGELKLGAESARVVGDAASSQARLIQAMTVEPDIKTVRSLAELQGNYGRVLLSTKDLQSALEPKERPFQPDRAQAITYAKEQLAATGRFDGLLPAGEYTFGSKTFHVAPGHEVVDIKLDKLPTAP